MIFSSRLIEDAVDAFSRLPGIGRKTALRMVLHLLKADKESVNHFSDTISRMRSDICFCPQCNNISDSGLCSICSNPMRDHTIICVVENIRDVISIESTRQFNGLYHVLGGLLSPLDGIGPDQLQLSNLIGRLDEGRIEEIIMALNPTIEGDTTVYYISRQLQAYPVRITGIARGVSFGGELEYTDELTLARSIAKRLPVETYVNTENKN
ncbi:recombination mediator RecR [Taibaiella koreensis]|uniref:recombination mediator RecR n=1 Tax=Taibaiella koreensis TaxID=1268548 RepID=UPI000E5992C7|nr:recombination mediator RecR [Taibaiella koreensis]